MTIITVRDVETNDVVIIRSIIDPIVQLDKKGEVQIIRIKKWIFDESDYFVPEELYGALEDAKVGNYVSLQYVIIKIENN